MPIKLKAESLEFSLLAEKKSGHIIDVIAINLPASTISSAEIHEHTFHSPSHSIVLLIPPRRRRLPFSAGLARLVSTSEVTQVTHGSEEASILETGKNLFGL